MLNAILTKSRQAGAMNDTGDRNRKELTRPAVASHGFTLIELSIVLVIIALIVAGVFVGRELIGISKLQSIVKEHAKLLTDINSFKLKYNCLPGDCENAVQKGLGTGSGNGNGQWDAAQENTYFLYQLRAAGYDYPATPLTDRRTPSRSRGAWFADYTNARNATTCKSVTTGDVFGLADLRLGTQMLGLMSGSVYADGGSDSAQGFLTVPEAMSIDRKLDDGLPRSGYVWASHYPFSGLPHPRCLSGTWDITDDEIRCGLIFVLK